MAQSQDPPEAVGAGEAKPSFGAFETEGGGYLIRGNDGQGGIADICLSETEMLSLAQSLQLLRDQFLTRLRQKSRSGSTVPVASVRVARALLDVDRLRGEVLLTLIGVSGPGMAYLLPDDVGAALAEHLPEQLAAARSSNPPTKQ
jgi:hypothetical protein